MVAPPCAARQSEIRAPRLVSRVFCVSWFPSPPRPGLPVLCVRSTHVSLAADPPVQTFSFNLPSSPGGTSIVQFSAYTSLFPTVGIGKDNGSYTGNSDRFLRIVCYINEVCAHTPLVSVLFVLFSFMDRIQVISCIASHVTCHVLLYVSRTHTTAATLSPFFSRCRARVSFAYVAGRPICDGLWVE